MNLAAQLLLNGLINGLLCAVFAIGFGLVYRNTRIFHIAYGSLAVLSALIFGRLMSYGIGWASAGLITLAASALLGWIIDAWFYSVLQRRGASSSAILVSSLGAAIVVENVLALFVGNENQTIVRETGAPLFIGSISITRLQVAQAVVCACLIASLLAMQRFRLFRIFRVMGENPGLLVAHGWRVSKFQRWTFMIATVVAAFPAIMWMADVGIDAHSGMNKFLVAVIAVVVGGTARMAGWVVGAILLALVQNLVAWRIETKWMDVTAFAVLLVVLLVRRTGVVSKRRRPEEV
jgi:branched-chain amino acid transport system permease protein